MSSFATGLRVGVWENSTTLCLLLFDGVLENSSTLCLQFDGVWNILLLSVVFLMGLGEFDGNPEVGGLVLLLVCRNQAAESLYQWKAEEVLQLNIVDVLIPQNLRKAGWEVVARVGYGESWSGALYCKRKDGVLLDTVFSETPIVDDDHNIVGGIAIDVTAAAAAAVVAKSSTSNLKQQQSSSSSSLSGGKEEGAAVENSSSLGTMTSMKPVAGSSESPTVAQTSDESPGNSLLVIQPISKSLGNP
jgi:hypothetical protein